MWHREVYLEFLMGAEREKKLCPNLQISDQDYYYRILFWHKQNANKNTGSIPCYDKTSKRKGEIVEVQLRTSVAN